MSTQKPTLIAYAVKERGKGRPNVWTRIGAAWPHSEGKGLTVEFEALPLDGRVVLIEPKAEEPAPAEAEPA